MSIELMTNVFSNPCDSSTKQIVLLCLADHANGDGVCWPSIERISARCALSERAVQNAIAILINDNRISLLAKGGGRGAPNSYQIFTVPQKGERQTVNLVPERVNVATERVHVVRERVHDVHPNHHEPSEPSDNHHPSSPGMSVDDLIPPQPDIQKGIIRPALGAYEIFISEFNKGTWRKADPAASAPKRRETFRARMKDPWWREHYVEGLARAFESDFLTGKVAGQWAGKGMDLEFFLRPNSLAYILEGKYDNPSGSGPKKWNPVD